MKKFALNILPAPALFAALACVALPACRTPPGNAGGASKDAAAESALLDEQTRSISGHLASEAEAAGAEPAGGARPLRPGETIIVRAWLSDMATMLPGYPYEIQVPDSDPLFLPHFGPVVVVSRSIADLERELLERFNPTAFGTVSTNTAETLLYIMPGDVLTVQVWLKDNISMPQGYPLDVQVSGSGDVFIPLIGLLPAAGSTLKNFEDGLRDRFAKILDSAQVIVSRKGVSAAAPGSSAHRLSHVSITRKPEPATTGVGTTTVEIGRHFIMLGRVSRPGLYSLRPGLRVRDAIAMAGGLERYARHNIFLVRGEGPSPEVMRIDMGDIMSGRSLEQNMLMTVNDAIYVAPKTLWSIADFISLLLMPIMQFRDAVYLYDRFVEQ